MRKTLNWLRELNSEGYKYIFRSGEDEVALTKGNKKKDGDFKPNAKFDFFKLEDGEKMPDKLNKIIESNVSARDVLDIKEII